MYIPSNFLYQVLCSEQSCVFCESNSQGERAIIAKVPTSTIKAVALGAKVEFYVYTTSKEPHYLALCLKIIDNLSSPFYVVIPQRWQNSNNVLNSSFFDNEIELVLYDDTDSPIQESKIKLKVNFRNKRIHYILSNMKLVSANDAVAADKFVDSICADLGFNYKAHPNFPLLGFKFPVVITNTRTINMIHANEQGTTQYHVVKDIDGSRQERQIYQSLCLMGGSQTVLSPLVTIGKKERELTDILTITHSRKLIAVESKCLQFDDKSFEKTPQRIASSIISHCNKAIGQLEGVYKTIKRGDLIYDLNHNPLLSDGDWSFYGIILIDEYRPSKDWVDIIGKLKLLSDKHHICLTVISVAEMFYTMKLCRSDIELFIESLEDRYKECIRTNTIDIRFRDSSLPAMI
ncbi:hypothetical protein AT520_003929 [Escherichia coli]